MQTVKVSRHVNASEDEIWALISDPSAYPQYMEPVEAITVLSEDENSLDVEWRVLLKGSLLVWVERERLDRDKLRIEFEQVDGDLEQFEGYWQIVPRDDGSCDVELEVTFEIGIPLLRDMLEPIAVKALRENSEAMLESLDSRMTL